MAWRTAVFRLAREAGWSNYRLARIMGVSEAQLSRVAAGRSTPGNHFRRAAKRAFPNYPESALVYWEDEPEEATPA